jgi:hypothetical protein
MHSVAVYWCLREPLRGGESIPKWARPENTFQVRTCAVHACLDMHERRAVYTISPDVGQHLEKSCTHEWCTHGKALFSLFVRRIKKKGLDLIPVLINSMTASIR